MVTTLAAEPGGARHSHQFFRESKDPKGKPCLGIIIMIIMIMLILIIILILILLLFY